MAWRPNANLIDGELDNSRQGAVTGWVRFFRRGQSPLKVKLDLEGDFQEDIRGKVIRFRNAEPSDEHIALDRVGTYMEGFACLQRGSVGDITAGLPLGPWTDALAQRLITRNELRLAEAGIEGRECERLRREFAEWCAANVKSGNLYYAYVQYPYIEWYADNGRVVLELDPSQVDVLEDGAPIPRDISAEQLRANESERESVFVMRLAKTLEGSPLEKSKRRRSAA